MNRTQLTGFIKVLVSVLSVLAIVILVTLIIVATLFPDIPGLEEPVPQPWSILLILGSVALSVALSLTVGAWALVKAFYLDEMKGSIAKLEGMVPKLGIIRDRSSLYRLPCATRWVIGAKLNYTHARIGSILDALEKGRYSQIAFLCIDTEYTDLQPNIRRLIETLKENYQNNSNRLKHIVSRIYIREIDANLIHFPLDIYDPYLDGQTKVAAYFPYARDFNETAYDMGFIITDPEGRSRGPTNYFMEKAEALWRRSKRTIWSDFKDELGIEENWNDVCYGIEDLSGEHEGQLQRLHEQWVTVLLAQATGLSVPAIEKFIQNARVDSNGPTIE